MTKNICSVTIRNTRTNVWFVKKESVMVLSYQEINDMAQEIVSKYRKLKENPCVNVNVEELMERLYGFKIRFYKLSKDNSILGIYSPVPIILSVFDKGKPFLVELDGKTALIDESLLQNNTGRKNFTEAHEGAHFILSHLRQSKDILYRDTICENKTIDWIEWQANVLAACILMPEDSVRYLFWKFYCAEHIEKISPFIKEYFAPFEAMAEFFGVSKQALGIRLKKLGLVNEIILSASISVSKEN